MAYEQHVKILDNFLPSDECDYFIERYKDLLQRSTVFGNAISDARTSSSFYLFNDDPHVISLKEKVAEYTRLPIENIEGIQLLRYEKDQQYQWHRDYFVNGEPYQRLHTFVIYLNDLTMEEGGATAFYHYRVKVYPKKGRAAWFRDAHDDGTVIPETLHAGEAIIGERPKYVLNVWVQNKACFSTA